MLRAFKSLVVIVIVVCFCMGTTPTTFAKTYWYESYLRAVDMIDAGRLQEASSFLDNSMRNHPVPETAISVPGDLLIDYLPYYQLARIEIGQGDEPAARKALAESLRFGAITESRRHVDGLDELRRTINAASN